LVFLPNGPDIVELYINTSKCGLHVSSVFSPCVLYQSGYHLMMIQWWWSELIWNDLMEFCLLSGFLVKIQLFYWVLTFEERERERERERVLGGWVHVSLIGLNMIWYMTRKLRIF
jgi:hypothetical protein